MVYNRYSLLCYACNAICYYTNVGRRGEPLGIIMRKTIYAVIVVAVVSTVVILYSQFDPAHSALAPKCPFYLLTGYQCPSCGVQRAVHAVLNGSLKAAFLFNPFLAVGLPYFLLLLLTNAIKSRELEPIRKVLHHKYMIWGYIILFFLWWVVRNTSWWHAILD